MITHLSHFIHYLYGFHEILEGLYNHKTSKKIINAVFEIYNRSLTLKAT
jgi:hypothetical protein